MKRVVKLEGKGNIAIKEIDVPTIASNEVLVKNVKSLISRGSELFARYTMPHAVNSLRGKGQQIYINKAEWELTQNY
jgi:hypothetical protein